jgi:hypothetical protein
MWIYSTSKKKFNNFLEVFFGIFVANQCLPLVCLRQQKNNYKCPKKKEKKKIVFPQS